MDKEEIICSHAGMYRFLASVFLVPPDAKLVALLKVGWIVNALGSFLTDEGKILFGSAIEADSSIEELRREFYDLFVVPTGQYTTPFEAVFRDNRDVAGEKVKGLLMGPSTAAVIESYRRAGAERFIKELPDHIGCELGFMEYLCSEEAKAAKAEKNDDAKFFQEEQRCFLEDHLLQWMPLLVARVSEKARLLWYKALSAAALGYMEFHLNEIKNGDRN